MTTILPYALTTREKVKDFLSITDVLSDTLIDSLINAQTTFIEKYCGGRRFASTAYVEVKDTYNSSKLFFNQKPVISVTSVQMRGGTPSTPTWTVYSADSYLTYLAQGYIQFFSTFRPIPQAFRLNYTAGYLIDWNNEMDPTKHTLPFDLTEVCTERIGKILNTRLSQGIYQESTEGQSVTYESDKYVLRDDHKTILNSYKLNRVAP